MWTDEGTHRFSLPEPPKGPGMWGPWKCLSATEDYVYLTCKAYMWRTPTAHLPKSGTGVLEITWEEVKGPGAELKLPAEWRYADLFACGDGAVLTVIGEKAYRLSDGGGKGEWKRVDNNLALRIVKAPVQGGALLTALRATVSHFRKTVEELDLPPVIEE